MPNELQLELTRLLGKKELTFGCIVKPKDKRHHLTSWTVVYSYKDKVNLYFDLSKTRFTTSVKGLEIIGVPPNLPDFHRWILESDRFFDFYQSHQVPQIEIFENGISHSIQYDSSKDLLDQSDETLSKIISLIKRNQ